MCRRYTGKIHERTLGGIEMITAKDATIKYSEGGNTKTNMSISKMFVLAFMAGVFISFAGSAATIAASTVENASLAKLLNALIFPAGLAMVVLNGSELFTGNNLMVISVLDKRISFLSMLKNWIVVYIGNLVGSMFISWMFILGHEYSIFGNAVAESVINTAVVKTNLSFEDAFVKAILCNILVCAAVMMAMMADNAAGKIAALYFPIMVFVVCSFEHSVANMGYISGGLFAKMKYGNFGMDVSGLTWYSFFIKNLFPVTLGNIVGGCLTGMMYWYTGKEK